MKQFILLLAFAVAALGQCGTSGKLIWNPLGGVGNGGWDCTGTSSGGGTPASPSTSVQFNNAGSFGGDALFTFSSTRKLVSIGATTKLAALNTQPQSSFVISTCTTTANATADIIGVGAGCLFTSNLSVGARIALSSDLTILGTVTDIISNTELLLDGSFQGDSLGDGTSQTITVYPAAFSIRPADSSNPYFVVGPNGHIGGSLVPLFTNGNSRAFTVPGSLYFMQAARSTSAELDTMFLWDLDAGTAPGDANNYSDAYVFNVQSSTFGSGLLSKAAVGEFAYGIGGGTGNVTDSVGIELQPVNFGSGTVGTAWGIHGLASAGTPAADVATIVCDDDTGGTSTACIKSAVNSGSGKWAINATGTAASHFGGNVEVLSLTYNGHTCSLVANVVTCP